MQIVSTWDYRMKCQNPFSGKSKKNISMLRILLRVLSVNHYENMPIQIYRNFYLQKIENFQIKNSDIFHTFAQNIDCGYPIEPPRRGGSNEYSQSMLWA